MKRDRLTWKRDHRASAPPADPGYGTEDQDHPAHQPDPEHEDYAQGDPDAWAETPNPPPYPEGNPPANPGYDVEDQEHPAYSSPPRVPKEARGLQASILAMAEAKADKCLKVAKLMLGGRKNVTTAMIEDQAFTMMDWPDEHLSSTLDRLGGGFFGEDDEVLYREEDFLEPDETSYMEDEELDELLASEEEEEESADNGKEAEEEEEGEDGDNGKEATIEALVALSDQVASLQEQLATLRSDQNDPDGDTLSPEPASEEEAREPEKTSELDPEEVALLAEMEAEAGGAQPMQPVNIAPTAEEEIEEEDEEVEEASLFSQTTDEMGNPVELTDDDAILNEIFGGRIAKKSEDEEEESEEEESEEEESEEEESEEEESEEEEAEESEKDKGKKASQRPQPRKPSKGVSRVGNVTRTASASGEMSDLSKLWESAPDVSGVFNSGK